MVPIRYNIRSLFVRKATTFATALGIGLVVFVFAGALMLNEGVNHAVAAASEPENVIVLRKGSDNELSSGFPFGNIALLGSRPQLASGAGSMVGEIVLVVTAERAGENGAISNMTVRGMPEAGYAFRSIKLSEGRLPKPGTNEAIIGKALNGRFLDPNSGKVIEPGNSVDLKRNRPLQIVGVFTAGGSTYESEVWGDLDVIRKLMGREGVVSSAHLKLKSADDFDAFKQSAENDPQLQVKVQREKDYLADQSADLAQFLSFLGILIAGMFSIAAMIGAAITMNAAVANRTREIGTLRALGFGKLQILFSFLFEAIVLAALGCVIGSLFVLILTRVQIPVMNFKTFSEIVISFAATPSVFTTALIFSVGMGLIGGLFPAIRAARISPVEAMRA